MMITFTYFGRLTDLTGKRSESIEMADVSVESIRNVLEKTHPELKQFSYQIAENNHILKGDDVVKSNELDVFPPFSGG